MNMEDHDRAVARFQRPDSGQASTSSSAGQPLMLGPTLSKKIDDNTYELIDRNEVKLKQAYYLPAYLIAGLTWLVLVILVRSLGPTAILVVSLAVFVIVFAPIFTFLHKQVEKKWIKRSKEFMHEEFVRYVGREPEFAYYSHGLRNGTSGGGVRFGIAFSDGKIFIIDRNVLKVIPLQDVVRVHIRYQQAIVYEPLIIRGLGLDQMMDARHKTEISQLQSLAASGIFIEVDDMERDFWQFMCADLPVLEKIYRRLDREIMRLNGKLPRS